MAPPGAVPCSNCRPLNWWKGSPGSLSTLKLEIHAQKQGPAGFYCIALHWAGNMSALLDLLSAEHVLLKKLWFLTYQKLQNSAQFLYLFVAPGNSLSSNKLTVLWRLKCDQRRNAQCSLLFTITPGNSLATNFCLRVGKSASRRLLLRKQCLFFIYASCWTLSSRPALFSATFW